MPKGYIIGHVTVKNPLAYKSYVVRNEEIFGRHGGRFIVRGGQSVQPEDPVKERHVIVEFPSFAAAQSAYDDPDYRENRKIRRANAESDIVIVEGVQ